MNMIEKVGDKIITEFVGQIMEGKIQLRQDDEGNWEMNFDNRTGLARAAIEAMREPDQNMTSAVCEPTEDRHSCMKIYTAMIDEALK